MLDEIPPANASANLFGHRQAETAFLDAYRSGRMHHAWLITGPPGIGKASFAFRAARYLLEYPDPADPAIASHEDLSVSPNSRAASKVAAGSHPNLLHLKRSPDEKTRKMRTVIVVDDVRRTQGFFGKTAAEGGWRVCVIDCADELNASAANAVLKSLEEPTDKALYLIVCHNPGRILPTIRSRCRTLRLRSLSPQDMETAIRSALMGMELSISDAELRTTIAASRGSVGRALMFLRSGGVEIADGFQTIMSSSRSIDRSGLHRFAQSVSGRDQDARFDLFCDLAVEMTSERIRLPQLSLEEKLRLTEASQSVTDVARETRIYNLDRKQAVIRMVETLAEATVSPISHQSG